MTEKIKYITNKELLLEIHRSKNSYSSFERPEFSKFDYIVETVADITPEVIALAKIKKATSLSTKTEKVNPDDIDPDDLVFRVMSVTHIPLDATGKRKPRNAESESLIRTNLPPFSHYVKRNGKYEEVGRSHWIGSISNGYFSDNHGKINNRLAMMMMLLVERYARRGNWRGYTYNDEMRSFALLQLVQVGLQFDESKSENPFAFYTQIITNCFRRILILEKKNQHIRDDLLIMAGVAPSFTRQIENEMDQQKVEVRQDPSEPTVVVEPPKKTRGRKPKVKPVIDIEHSDWTITQKRTTKVKKNA